MTFCFLYKENKKKPKLTIANLKAKAVKGDDSSTITLLVIKADDHKKTKVMGNNLIT